MLFQIWVDYRLGKNKKKMRTSFLVDATSEWVADAKAKNECEKTYSIGSEAIDVVRRMTVDLPFETG